MKQTKIQRRTATESVVAPPTAGYNPKRLLSFVDLVSMNDALETCGWDAAAYVQLLVDLTKDDDPRVRLVAAERLRAHSLETMRMNGLIRDVHVEQQQSQTGDDPPLTAVEVELIESRSRAVLAQLASDPELTPQEGNHAPENEDGTNAPDAPAESDDRSYADIGHRPPESTVGRGLCAGPAADQ